MKMEQPSFENIPEEVKESALRFRGEVFTGLLHVHALDKLELKHLDWSKHKEEIEDGFTTNRGRFVNRDEADGLAREKLEREKKI